MSSSPVHVSAASPEDPEAWVVVGRDLRSFQEVSLVDGELTVVWPRKELAAWRPFYCSSFHNACRETAGVRQSIGDQLALSSQSIDIPSFPCIKSLFQRSLCDVRQRARAPLCLMVAGSDDSAVKRDLLAALLGVRLHASLGEHVLVRYVFVPGTTYPPIEGHVNDIKSVSVHFRSDAMGTGVRLDSLPEAIAAHLKRNGAGAPLLIKSYRDLVQLLSRDLTASSSELDSGWEPVSNSFASLLQEVVIEVSYGEQSSSASSSSGLEILDGPSVQEIIDNPTALHNNANILVCALHSPSALPRAHMIRLMSFGSSSRTAPSSSPLFFFADCRSHSDEDACKFTVDAESASAPAEATHMIFEAADAIGQHGLLESAGSTLHARGISAHCPGMERFTRCLTSFAKSSQRESSFRLLQDSTCLLQEIKTKINVCHSLISRDSDVALQGSSLRAPELLSLRREHQAAVCEVQLLVCSRRDEVIRVAEQFIRECADLMPNFAEDARPSIRVGVIGSLYGTSREGFAKEIEAHVRVKLEERINLWSVQTLLPLIDSSLKFLESKLGHRAQAHVLKLNDITGTVAKRGAIAFEARKAADSSNSERHLSILSSVPTVSNQLASYFDVTKSLLTIVSGHLIASSGLIVVGALCSIASVIRAWRSSGSETEQAIKQLVGNEMGKLLRLKASDIARTISEKLLEPISDFIAHYEESFTAEVDMLIQSMEAGRLLRAEPHDLEAKLQLLQNAAASVDKAADYMCR
jgi:hypothetical protein